VLSLCGTILLRDLEPDMLVPQRLYFEAFAPELSLHVGIHRELIAVRKGIASRDRWVMAHLLAEILELGC
jgi:hypothetical protein